jgi:predicted DNA-binding transcriptional regulator AlpA
MTDREKLVATLLAEPHRAGELSAGEAAALLADLAVLQQQLVSAAFRATSTLSAATNAPARDRMLDVNVAAAALGVTSRWLYRHHRQMPFTRRLSAKVLRFSEAGIAKWLATRRT